MIIQYTGFPRSGTIRIAAVPVRLRHENCRLRKITRLCLLAEPGLAHEKNRSTLLCCHHILSVLNHRQQQVRQGMQWRITMQGGVHPQPDGRPQNFRLIDRLTGIQGTQNVIFPVTHETFSEIPEQIKTGCHITRHKTRRL